MPIILQQNICRTAYLYNPYIMRINKKLLFFDTPNWYLSYYYGILHGNYVGKTYIIL